MASKLLRNQFDMKINLKMGSRDHSPDASSVCSQGSTTASNKASFDMNLLCDRFWKPRDTVVQFCNNENVTVIELCAKNIKPLPRPRTKKKPKDTFPSPIHQRTTVNPHSDIRNNSSSSPQLQSSTHSRRGLRSNTGDPSPNILPGFRRKRKQLEVNGYSEATKRVKLDDESSQKSNGGTLMGHARLCDQTAITIAMQHPIPDSDQSRSQTCIEPLRSELNGNSMSVQTTADIDAMRAPMVTPSHTDRQVEIPQPVLNGSLDSEACHSENKQSIETRIEKPVMESNSVKEKSTDHCGVADIDMALCPPSENKIDSLTEPLNKIFGDIVDDNAQCTNSSSDVSVCAKPTDDCRMPVDTCPNTNLVSAKSSTESTMCVVIAKNITIGVEPTKDKVLSTGNLNDSAYLAEAPLRDTMDSETCKASALCFGTSDANVMRATPNTEVWTGPATDSANFAEPTMTSAMSAEPHKDRPMLSEPLKDRGGSADSSQDCEISAGLPKVPEMAADPTQDCEMHAKLPIDPKMSTNPPQDCELRAGPCEERKICAEPCEGREVRARLAQNLQRSASPSHDLEVFSERSKDHEICAHPSKDHDMCAETSKLDELCPGPSKTNEMCAEAAVDGAMCSGPPKDLQISADPQHREVCAEPSINSENCAAQATDHVICVEPTTDILISTEPSKATVLSEICAGPPGEPEMSADPSKDCEMCAEPSNDHENCAAQATDCVKRVEPATDISISTKPSKVCALSGEPLGNKMTTVISIGDHEMSVEPSKDNVIYVESPKGIPCGASCLKADGVRMDLSTTDSGLGEKCLSMIETETKSSSEKGEGDVDLPCDERSVPIELDTTRLVAQENEVCMQADSVDKNNTQIAKNICEDFKSLSCETSSVAEVSKESKKLTVNDGIADLKAVCQTLKQESLAPQRNAANDEHGEQQIVGNSILSDTEKSDQITIVDDEGIKPFDEDAMQQQEPINFEQADDKLDSDCGELTSVGSSVTTLKPSVDIDDDDTSVLSDVSSLKKLVPEVCACDTTTGSTDDELSGNKPSTVVVEEILPHLSDETPSAISVENTKPKKMSTKMSRRQWARELTKIRMKINERKRMTRQAGLMRARQTRRKSLEAKKAQNVAHKSKMVDSPSMNISEGGITVATSQEEITAFASSEEHFLGEMDGSGATCDAAADKVVDGSNNTGDENDEIPNLNNSSNGGFGSIEIVDDEGEDEDPWPFVTSPSQASNMPTPNSACSQKSMASPTPSFENELPLSDEARLSIAVEDVGEPQSVSECTDTQEKTCCIPIEPTINIDNITPLMDVAKTSSNGSGPEEILPNDGKLSSAGDDEAFTFDTSKDTHSISTDSTVTCIDTEKSSMNSEESISVTPESSPRKREFDHFQQAKMHSRSAEVRRTNSLADSMWKDMFNSDVIPLDFDDATTTKTRGFKNQLLPAVYQKSQGVLHGQEEITINKLATDPTFENTPCGDSYPIDKADASEPLTASTLKLCSCKFHSSPVNQNKKKPGLHMSYCQAVETVANKISNCMTKISDRVEGRRASSTLPYMALCKVHRKKLSQHSCCPVCGLFCTGGNFIDCMSGRGHLHHSTCQVKGDDGVYLCPHCGEKSSQVSVNFASKNDVDFQRTKKISKKQNNEGIARMCIRLVTKPTLSGGGDHSNLSYDSKLFEVSKSTLLDGAAKTKLITILSGLEHLVPAMREKLGSSRVPLFNLHDLSSSIFKNDLSQLALGICELMNKSNVDGLLTLNKPFGEHEGRTLLHLAVLSNSLATVHCLVMAGVEVNIVDTKGISPLMLASKANQIDTVKYLIGAGALVEWRDVDGMTTLHFAAVAGNKAICEYLLREVDANIDCADEGGWTPLVWAIENGHSHVVKLLLNSEASIHKRDTEGNACIHWGAYSGNTEIIKLLINRGADIEAVNELGDRPLHIAVKQARTDAVILLLSHGADTSAINNLYQTPAECCHGACSDNMKSFLTVNDVLRSCRIGDVTTRSSRLLQQDIARGKEKVPIPVTNDVDNINYPTDFTYVTESVWTSPVPINTMISSLSKCNCLGDCTRASCGCARSSISCWYEYGVLTSSFDFTNPPQIFECNKACGCWATCSNRVVQQGITAQLELFKTKGRGWGVKARHEIAKGTFVCEYVGELITDSEADQREDDSYLFDLDCKDGDTYCMDAKRYGNISRFINHRCEPNLTPVNVFVDHQDVRFPRICLFANTDIEMGTELGFDYGEKFWLVKYKHFLCDCGCKTCKYNEKTIADTLSQNQQQQATVDNSATKSPI